MPKQTPSTFQEVFSRDVAERMNDLLRDTAEKMISERTHMLGNPGGLATLPPSMRALWAAESAERLRKMMLDYWRESGLFPEA
jgi:hypothetical protein